MKEQKGLQKLTDLQVVNELLAKERITMEDHGKLTESQVELLSAKINETVSKLRKKEEKTAFLEKIEDIFDKDTRNQIWQNNHVSIQAAMSNLLLEYKRMPSVNEIAEHTGLSRQTIYKHLTNFDLQELYQEEWNKLSYLSVNLAAKVLKEAQGGNMKAARLFFDIVSGKPAGKYTKNTFIKNEQNNYLTINNLRLDEPTLNSMPPDLLEQIESFVKSKEKNQSDKPSSGQEVTD